MTRVCALLVLLLAPLASSAQSTQGGEAIDPAAKGAMEFDFLFNYYNQDGENSAVTGGIGTEAMDVVAPVVVLNWQLGDVWSLRADVGADTISSASVDAMDDAVSSASELDVRAHSSVTMSRDTGRQTLGFTTGLSREYDYASVSLGLSWAREFNQENTTTAVSARHYADTIDLYDIDGVNQGTDDRGTTDVSISLTQVLSKRSVGSIELSLSDQRGFLSTPFQEVITGALADPLRIAERLPDRRRRTALGLRYNHAFSKDLIGRFQVRAYDDDWGVQATSVEVEPHFRLRRDAETWIFPILRFHDQQGSDYFGLPGAFDGSEPFLTADRDLSTFSSQKYGIGWRTDLKGAALGTGWTSFETRLTWYTRDDGLDAISTSFAFGWKVR